MPRAYTATDAMRRMPTHATACPPGHVRRAGAAAVCMAPTMAPRMVRSCGPLCVLVCPNGRMAGNAHRGTPPASGGQGPKDAIAPGALGRFGSPAQLAERLHPPACRAGLHTSPPATATQPGALGPNSLRALHVVHRRSRYRPLSRGWLHTHGACHNQPSSCSRLFKGKLHRMRRASRK